MIRSFAGAAIITSTFIGATNPSNPAVTTLATELSNAIDWLSY